MPTDQLVAHAQQIWQAGLESVRSARLMREAVQVDGSTLVIDGETVNENFGRAARSIPDVDVLPVQGINVYDILRRDTLVLTRAAVDALEARFK